MPGAMVRWPRKASHPSSLPDGKWDRGHDSTHLNFSKGCVMGRIDDLLDQYDNGRLSRRQLLSGLLMLAMPSALAAKQAASTGAPTDPLRARTINHVHIIVNNY